MTWPLTAATHENVLSLINARPDDRVLFLETGWGTGQHLQDVRACLHKLSKDVADLPFFLPIRDLAARRILSRAPFVLRPLYEVPRRTISKSSNFGFWRSSASMTNAYVRLVYFGSLPLITRRMWTDAWCSSSMSPANDRTIVQKKLILEQRVRFFAAIGNPYICANRYNSRAAASSATHSRRNTNSQLVTLRSKTDILSGPAIESY